MTFCVLKDNSESCRICLEDDDGDNMIYPCKCSGTSKYVHKICLNQWRTLSNNPEAYEKCFECQYKYKFLDPSAHQNRELGIFSKFFRYIAMHIMSFLALTRRYWHCLILLPLTFFHLRSGSSIVYLSLIGNL